MYEGEDPMAELFDEFPYLTNDYLIIRKMTVEDVPALSQISHNEQVYRFIPMSFYKKNDRFLETAIGHLGGRDEDLLSMHHIVVAIAHGACLQLQRVQAGVGLGHAKAGLVLALDQRR